MAKVSAHGTIIGTIHYLTYSKRFMSDGHILKQYGPGGWKLYSKVKAGFTPQEAYQNALEHQKAHRAHKPAYDAYARLLDSVAGAKCKRWKLNCAVQMMPDDPDGVWSECCDGYGDNIHADLDDVVELCRAFKAAEREQAESRVSTS